MANDFINDALDKSRKVLDHADKFTKSIPGPHPMPTYQTPHDIRVAAGTATRTPRPAPQMSAGEDAAAGIRAKQKNVGDYVKAVSEE